MRLDEAARRALVEALANTVSENSQRMTELDQAIGDGDHGINMKRGFDAILENVDDIAGEPLPEALKAAGMKLVMTVGGASGPLFGTLFMSLGKGLTDDQPDLAQFSLALNNAIDAVMARGKSVGGQKTMLDVLIPVAADLAQAGPDLVQRLPDVADRAAAATIPMLATKGRASFLGERSIGHMDPGAFSTALLVRATCDALGWEIRYE